MHFTKLFNSILDSTIWQEPPATKICWITMLAMCDRNGDVFASIPGLANRAGISIDETEDAIRTFLSPDKYSRTKDFEGKRIAEIQGGWTLLNHGKYRELLSKEERKEYNRLKQAESRKRRAEAKAAAAAAHVNDMSKPVNKCQQMSALSAHTDTDTDTDTLIVASKARFSGSPDASVHYPPEIEALWKIFPATSRNRSSKQKLARAWAQTKQKPDINALLESARAWATCDQWTKDGGQFAPGAHIWVKDRKWESEPEAAPKVYRHAGIHEPDTISNGF